MNLPSQTIAWPAVIQYRGDPELELIENAEDWQQFHDSVSGLDPADRLIDSSGQAFRIDSKGEAKWQDQLSLEDVLGVVKAHMADSGACCVAKTYAPSIHEAIEMVFNNQCSIDQT